MAAAEAAGADYFITVDNRLIRGYRRRTDPVLVVSDPTTFVREIAGQELE